MATFIRRVAGAGAGLRVAVKDIIDMRGLPTTAGSKVVAARAGPAERDAACLAGIRAAEAARTARIVGKANLHELALGVSGINPWFGTPINPLDATLVPGGSSSGSAVAVGDGEADVALGTDTGGSVRIPAACCGVVGLKTTWGRVPLDGVRPLASSLDTVGPMARDIGGTAAGMELLEPGFTVSADLPRTVGRLRLPANPVVDDAIDRALSAAELEVTEVDVPGWPAAEAAAAQILLAEAWQADGHLLQAGPGALTEDVAVRLLQGEAVGEAGLDRARAVRARWQAELDSLFGRVELVALPTLTDFPPSLQEAERSFPIRATLPVNLAGVPALAVPVPSSGRLPASVQLVGPALSEDRLLAAGGRLERSCRG